LSQSQQRLPLVDAGSIRWEEQEGGTPSRATTSDSEEETGTGRVSLEAAEPWAQA
jgi:hypothetical protein